MEDTDISVSWPSPALPWMFWAFIESTMLWIRDSMTGNNQISPKKSTFYMNGVLLVHGLSLGAFTQQNA
jgi:hypothetical protein